MKSHVLIYEIWRSLCNRYWIARCQGVYRGESWFSCGTTKNYPQFGTNHSKYHDDGMKYNANGTMYQFASIYRCIEEVKKHFRKANKGKDCYINENQFLQDAVYMGLSELPKVVKVTPMMIEASRPIIKQPTTDKFGTDLGTEESKLNSCLSKKPRSLLRLMRRAKVKGATGDFYMHLRRLVRKELVELVVKKGKKFYKIP